MNFQNDLLTIYKEFNNHTIQTGNLIGREHEYNELKLVIQQYKQLQHFGLTLIHGTSGVGKTSLIKQLIKDTSFLKQIDNEIQIVYINILECKDKKTILNSLSDQLFSENINFEEIKSYLNSYENGKIIIILDEIDNLKKKCKILYDWIFSSLFGIENSKNCIVIGISNETQDFYSLLNDFDRSPFTCQMLYSKNTIQELKSIIKTKSKNSFEEKAIDIIAQDVFNKNGDIRRLYSLCSNALFFALQENAKKVSLLHVLTSNGNYSNDNSTKNFLNNMNKIQKCICCSLFMSKPVSDGKISVQLWFTEFKKILKLANIRDFMISQNQFLNQISILASQGIIKVIKNNSNNKISFVIPTYDNLVMYNVLSQVREFKGMIEEVKNSSRMLIQ